MQCGSTGGAKMPHLGTLCIPLDCTSSILLLGPRYWQQGSWTGNRHCLQAAQGVFASAVCFPLAKPLGPWGRKHIAFSVVNVGNVLKTLITIWDSNVPWSVRNKGFSVTVFVFLIPATSALPQEDLQNLHVVRSRPSWAQFTSSHIITTEICGPLSPTFPSRFLPSLIPCQIAPQNL